MLKTIQTLGQSLTKEQQQEIKGGSAGMPCNTNRDCWDSHPYLGPGDISCRYNPWGHGKVCQFN